MSDPPPRRSLRLPLIALVLMVVWGYMAPIAADARSDSPVADSVVRARTSRALVHRALNGNA